MRWLACVAALSALLGCGAEPAADNLLFISFDTTRADRLSAYGHAVATSPSIDAVAARGALFERAYSHVPSTLSAHSSMLTGLLPPSHAVRCNGKLQLAEERLTLAEILHDSGFATAAVLAAFPLDGRFGLAQGFDLYDDDFAATAAPAPRDSISTTTTSPRRRRPARAHEVNGTIPAPGSSISTPTSSAVRTK